MGVWQGVAMDSLKFHLGVPSSTLLFPAAVFHPIGHPTPYAYERDPEPLWSKMYQFYEEIGKVRSHPAHPDFSPYGWPAPTRPVKRGRGTAVRLATTESR
jgi:hypothetical protein